MLNNHTAFFKPSRLMRSLSILEAINGNTGITQKALAKQTHMSEAMVNQYIKFPPKSGQALKVIVVEMSTVQKGGIS